MMAVGSGYDYLAIRLEPGDAFGSGGRFNTCFMLETAKGVLLVDFGASSLVALKARGIDPLLIDGIVISHLHGDHFGALPFLLPLMLQVGFHKTPFQSGLITFATAVGAMSMKTAIPSLLRRFGYRNVLTYNAVISSAFVAACGLFSAATPVIVMLAVLFAGGFFRSLQFTSAMTIGFAEVEPRRMSRATSLAAVSQQLSVSTGVALGRSIATTHAAFSLRRRLIAPICSAISP